MLLCSPANQLEWYWGFAVAGKAKKHFKILGLTLSCGSFWPSDYKINRLYEILGINWAFWADKNWP